ncbi:hypothetical protein TrRE_jg7503 [Triparma retinervis]|uniref:Uncharacterized protein n=1 Tax=Triparma retinervis TaxID=2557542 RepID=A0A9W7ECD1_9STRA|nr:hypothetical protein TrRE_jg7503 [Triparma retinervis]
MPDSYLKKANRKDGLHPNLKKRMMTLEEKRIARLRNVKSTGYNNNQGDEWSARKAANRGKGQRRKKRQQPPPDFDVRPDLKQWGGASKSGLRAKTLRDTDYIVTDKQYHKQQQMLRAPTNASSLPSLPNPSKYGPSDDDMLSYLDNSSLTEEQIEMQLPHFEVGMTDKTIPVSEKRCVPKGVHDMITMMEEEAQSALDFLNENNKHPNHVSPLPETPEQKPSPGTIFHSSSTSKKKRRPKADPAVSKTANGRVRRNLNGDMGKSSPMRGRLRKHRPKVPQAVQITPQQTKGWDPNYARPWRDNKPKKVKRKPQYVDESVQVYHPSKSHGVYKSSSMGEMYGDEVVYADVNAENFQHHQENTPIKKRVQKAKRNLKPKTKEIDELNLAADFAHKVAEADEILHDDDVPIPSMEREPEDDEHDEEASEEGNDVGQDVGGDQHEAVDDPNVAMDFSSQQQTLDDYNEWWRKQQEQPGAAAIPQIEMGGLGAVSPVKGMRNIYEGSPSPVNPNDVSATSATSSVEAALQEKIERMELVIKEQSGKIESLASMVKSNPSLSPTSAKVADEGSNATTPTSIRRKSRFAFDPPTAGEPAAAVSPLSSSIAPSGTSPSNSSTVRRKSSVQFSAAAALPIPSSVALPGPDDREGDSDSSFEKDSDDGLTSDNLPDANLGRRRSSVKPGTPVKWAKIDLDAMDDEDEDEVEDGVENKNEIKNDAAQLGETITSEKESQRRKSSISFSPESREAVEVVQLGERRRSSVKPGTPIKWAKIDLDAYDDDDDEEEEEEEEDYEDDTIPIVEQNQERRRSSVSFAAVEQSIESDVVQADAPDSGKRRASIKEKPTPIKRDKIDLDNEDEDEGRYREGEREPKEETQCEAVAGTFDESTAATKLQNKQRQRAAKKRVEGKRREKKEKEEKEENSAAVVLQGKARQRVARNKVEEKRREKINENENSAAVILQGKARQREARKKVEGKRNEKRQKEKEENSAAVVLQGRARQRVAKKKVEEKRREKKVENLANAGSEMEALFGPPPTIPSVPVVPALPLADTVLQKEVDLEESLEESAELPLASSQKLGHDPKTPSPAKSPLNANNVNPGDAEEIGEDEDVIMTDRSEGLGGKIYHADGSYTTTTTTVDKEVRRLSTTGITSPEAAVDVVVDEEDDYDDEDYSFDDDDEFEQEEKKAGGGEKEKAEKEKGGDV